MSCSPLTIYRFAETSVLSIEIAPLAEGEILWRSGAMRKQRIVRKTVPVALPLCACAQRYHTQTPERSDNPS
jgi:hypothetical protein